MKGSRIVEGNNRHKFSIFGQWLVQCDAVYDDWPVVCLVSVS